jgi:hypothetical protein
MPTTERPRESKPFYAEFDKHFRSIKEHGKRVLLWVLVVAVFIFEWHLLDLVHLEHYDELLKRIIITILIILGAGVIEVIFSTRESLDRLSKDVQNKVATNRLRSLTDCAKHLSEKLDEVEPKEKVVIDHFGLDMVHAWAYLRDDVLNHPNLKDNDVEIRILILSPYLAERWEKDVGADIPDEIATWFSGAKKSLETIKKEAAEIITSSSKDKKKNKNPRIKIQVKSYNVLPTVHGISIRQPIKVRYISFCRWKGLRYDWGEHDYRTITDLSDPVLKAEADMFQGNFNYLWSKSQSEFPVEPVKPHPNPLPSETVTDQSLAPGSEKG